jgi:tRNA dimethylallyltransferase
MYDRINQRVDLMLQEGLLTEAEQLHPHKALNALQTVGYRELFEYFDGIVTLDQAVENIKMNTRRFAKRQITWFKRTENTTWFDYKTDTNTIVKQIENKFLNPKS